MRLPLGILLLISLACGGGGSGDPYGGPTDPPGNTPNNPPTSPPSGSVSVEMTSTGDGYGGDVHAFAPNRVTVSRGGTVTWSNATGHAHNVTFAGANAPQRITDFSSGSVARTFPSAGTFPYSCTNHSGMTGEVVVP